MSVEEVKMEKFLEKVQNFGGLSNQDKVVVGGSLGNYSFCSFCVHN